MKLNGKCVAILVANEFEDIEALYATVRLSEELLEKVFRKLSHQIKGT